MKGGAEIRTYVYNAWLRLPNVDDRSICVDASLLALDCRCVVFSSVLTYRGRSAPKYLLRNYARVVRWALWLGQAQAAAGVNGTRKRQGICE